MTRPEQVLLLMAWTMPFFGLSPADAAMMANSVLDDFDGDISESDPIAVIEACCRKWCGFKADGVVSFGLPPLWQELGITRPAEMDSPDSAVLDDETSLHAYNLGLAMAQTEFPIPVPAPGHDPFTGIMPDGSLILESGGVVPAVPADLRERVWVPIMANPRSFDQESIDELVQSPPDLPDEPTREEAAAIAVYEKIVSMAIQHALIIDEQHIH